MAWRNDRALMKGHDWEPLPQKRSANGEPGPLERMCRRCGQMYVRKVRGMFSKKAQEEARILPCDEGLVKVVLES